MAATTALALLMLLANGAVVVSHAETAVDFDDCVPAGEVRALRRELELLREKVRRLEDHARVTGVDESTSGASTGNASHLHMLGFYSPHSIEPFAAQKGIANWRYVGDDVNGTEIQRAYDDYGMKTFLAVPWAMSDCGNFPDYIFNASTCGAVPGYQGTIKKLLDARSAQLQSGALGGIFLGDEPVCGGVPATALSEVANFCKAELRARGAPNALVWVNECAISFTGETAEPMGGSGRDWAWIKELPAGLDIISMDAYEFANSTRLTDDPWYLAEPRENREMYEQFIYPMLHAHQRVMVVPGLYGNLSARANDPEAVAAHDQRLLLKFEQYFKWAQADEHVVGFFPYHWGDECLPTSACLKNHSTCRSMCYTGVGCKRPAVCGTDGDLMGAGAESFPKLAKRMREVGVLIANNTKLTGLR